jgi:phospholipid/cholesterol/gamma-HCH transport system substrate-binding protein
MNAVKTLFRRSPISPVKLGIAFVIVSLVAGVALFQKNRITTTLTPGETITLQFAEAYRLREFVSDAKVAGVPVGTVSSVERVRRGLTEVKVKVDHDVVAKLRSAPSAAIRPTTLLGGNYYVELKPGGLPGHFSGTIPLSRTKLPVELDKVSAALQPNARQGIRSSVRDLDKLLRAGGSDALRDLVRTAPDTLTPAAGAFEGMRGTRKRTDLRDVVRGMEATGRALSEQQDQLDQITRDLSGTSAVLGRRGEDMAAVLASMPSTLDSTDEGLRRLDTTMAKLRSSADVARPAVRKLGSLVTHLDPVLAEARPVIRDLRGVLKETRPLVRSLAPASSQLKQVFDDVRGPVLRRVNGPILHTVNSPFKGTGSYAGSGSKRRFYQELAHMVTNADRITMTDRNGAMISFLAGNGPGTVAGLPISLEQLFRQLSEGQEEGR